MSGVPPPRRTMTEATASARSRIQQVRQELDHARANGPLKTILIPPCPELLARMRDALSVSEPDLNEVARIAGNDVAMSAVLLKAANSPAYTTGMPVATVGQAMNRLGLDHTAREMTRYIVRGAIPVNTRLLQRFWERSTKCAVAMAHIASKLPGMSVDMAHTYGLFAHVGMPVMMQSIKGYGSTMVEAAARIDRPFIATENANHRTDHAVVGALVARVWQLAPEIMVAIRRHHDLDMLGDLETEPEVHSLVAAGLVADHLMRRHEALPSDVDWVRHHPQALAWLQIDDEDVQQWEEELAPLLDEL